MRSLLLISVAVQLSINHRRFTQESSGDRKFGGLLWGSWLAPAKIGPQLSYPIRKEATNE